MRSRASFACSPVVFVSLSLVAGCGLTLDYDPGDDAAALDAAATDGGSVLDAGALDAATTDAAVDAASGGECSIASECEPLFGVAPCGAWECVAGVCEVACADCTDADRDGYGVGAGCAGADCDDSDRAIADAHRRACYGGPAGSDGVGICAAGLEECVSGAWLPCTGEITPQLEICNGADDDCDGASDDVTLTTTCGLGACASSATGCASGAPVVCVPRARPSSVDTTCDGTDDDCDGATDEDCGSCVYVRLGGDDGSTTPRSASTPFATIQRAIDFAAADASLPQRVCVMTTDCGSTAFYDQGVRMRDGVDVVGSHGPTGARCGTLRTAIRARDHSGILFDASVTRAELADVIVIPFRPSSGSTAGITVDGARGVVITGVRVDPGEAVPGGGYGIDVLGGAEVTVSRSEVYAGRGAIEGVGLRAVGSRVQALDDCDTLDAAGRCTTQCRAAGGLGFHGRIDTSGNRSLRSHAILLIDSPRSLVRGTATCAHVSDRAASIRIEGDVSGTRITRSFVAGWGGSAEQLGIELDRCGGTVALIDDNHDINAEAPPGAAQAAVRVHAGCDPIIAVNRRIAAALEGTGDAVAVDCGDATSSTPARCQILANTSILGAAGFGVPTSAIGVRCRAGSCGRIEGNVIAGGNGVRSIGVEAAGGPLSIARNTIAGGCVGMESTALSLDAGWGRIENNVLFAGGCAGGTTLGTGATYRAAWIRGGPGRGALDLHSNTLHGGGVAGACQSRVIELGPSASGGAGATGYFRNTLMVLGACAAAVGVLEASGASDPILMSHQLLDAGGRAVALYRDEGATDLFSAAEIDALGDATILGTLALPAALVAPPADLHPTASSPAIGAGVAGGMPPVDRDGAARDPTRPDLGAFVGP